MDVLIYAVMFSPSDWLMPGRAEGQPLLGLDETLAAADRLARRAG